MEQEIKGTVSMVVYKDEESFWCKVIFKTEDGKKFPATGLFPEIVHGDLKGLRYKLIGEFVKDKKYGEYFKANQVLLEEEPVFYFLKRVIKDIKGVGERRIKKIIDRFGKKTAEVIEKHYKALASVEGITLDTAKEIHEAYIEYKPKKELYELLLPFGVYPNKIDDVYMEFKRKAIDIIKKNPYDLLRVDGIGFKTADKVALYLGHPLHSETRYEAGIFYILKEEAKNNGHTFISVEDLIRRLEELNITKEDLIDKVISESKYITKEGRIVYLNKYKKYEEYIVRRLIDKLSRRLKRVEDIDYWIAKFEAEEGIILTKKQREALRLLEEGYGFFIISGYAGTGKTTLMKAVFYILSRLYRDLIICAFTGIASERARNATNYNACTIHSLLGWNGVEFRNGKHLKLLHNVIALDEASMVDVELMKQLVESIDDDSVFIMVGDPAQLPPVGAGNVFQDLVESDAFPAVYLDEVVRTGKGSHIAIVANEIRDGKVPKGYNKNDNGEFFFIEVNKSVQEETNKEIQEIIRQAVERLVEIGDIQNVITDVQIITPMRKGKVGTAELNNLIQDILNPQGKEGLLNPEGEEKEELSFVKDGIEMVFREGDKVMHINRNIDMPVVDEGDNVVDKMKVFNGMMGILRKVDTKNKVLIVDYNGILVRYDFKKEAKRMLTLAYAITVHKAQGSEFKNVIIPMSRSHYRMWDNKLLYTAITRAKDRCVVIGQSSMFKRACSHSSSVKRLTHTPYLIEELSGMF